MPIIYSIISRGNTVLAEYTSNSGNFVQITRRILDRIPTSKPTKVSYVYDRYVFHCCVDDGLIYICMTDQDFPRRIPFAFLDDIKSKFKAAYGDRGRQALAYELNEDFKKVLQKQMETFSNDPQVDRISRVRAEIDDVKGIMLENIDKVLERGDKIEILVDKTATLVTQSWKFKEGAKESSVRCDGRTSSCGSSSPSLLSW
eukprot:EC715849.1.p1 GENE.EC715849.1~~EC715849.1.p1  ORF type:complete len:201 (+),score=33.17 EC715849.1:50-652(+)